MLGPFNVFFSESTEERITMHKALKQNNSIFSRYYLNEDFNEIKFDFELVDDIIVGENFRFELSYFNLTLNNKLLIVCIVCTITNYTVLIVNIFVNFKLNIRYLNKKVKTLK